MKKTRVFTIITSALAIIFIAGYFVLQGVIDKKFKELEDVKKQITIADNKFLQIRNQNQLLSSDSDEDVLNSLFLKEDKVVDFIEEIEGFDDVLGTDTSITKIDEIENSATGNPEISLTINSVGSFDQLIEISKLLENMPFEVSFTGSQLSQELTREGEFVDSWKLSADIIIHTYRKNK
ncbi:hypothetical protein H6790_00910 [Candidatus Nomurabacteria bacterium]|nr:hypothetical protein [Candidatus Nomurabacteria bacterium]MCB9820491.1 hypothetical protein [Candidatus Nomurabacteria bacterium]